jgi:hypothetical protein
MALQRTAAAAEIARAAQVKGLARSREARGKGGNVNGLVLR